MDAIKIKIAWLQSTQGNVMKRLITALDDACHDRYPTHPLFQQTHIATVMNPPTDPIDDSDHQHHSKDLIIDEGFAVLNTFRVSKRPDNQTSESDPIPRYPFASFQNAVQIHPTFLPVLLDECELVFSARDVEEGQAYSSGVTFFLPAVASPRCALEALVHQIFKVHTEDLIPGRHYDIERSGAEWWTLVLDSNSASDQHLKSDPDGDELDEDDAEIGMHFDADYGLEEQLPNYMIHPRIATVTYLSDIGVPTLILDKKSPPPSDIQKLSLDGEITRGWLSCPSIGKHTAFDGRFLHGAPSSFFPAMDPSRNSNTDTDSKRRKLNEYQGTCSEAVPTSTTSSKRVTLLVNIWINHCPLDAEMMDEELCSQLSPVWSSDQDSSPNPILWILPNVKTSDPFPITQLSATKSIIEEAGVETAILCNHNVVLHFRSSKEDLLSVVCDAKDATGQSIEVNFDAGALVLELGDEVSDESEREGDEIISIES